MVVVKSENADLFLANSVQKIAAFLFFGSDSGLLSERASTVVKAIDVDSDDPFQLIRLDGADIAADPTRLIDETNTFSLFGSKRAIKIELGSSEIAAVLEAVLRNPQPDWKIIVEAGALKRESNIRRLCERHHMAIAVECNADRPADLNHLLSNALSDIDVKMDDDAKDYFLSTLGSDRLCTRSELEKLRLFADGLQNINVSDVEALTADASILALDVTINTAFSGNLAGLEEAWKRLSASGVDGSTMLGSALREAMSLHQYHCVANQGSNGFNSAEQRYSRGYGRKPLSFENLRRWTPELASQAIEILGTAVLNTRHLPALSQEIAVRALWAIAFSIRP